VIGLGDDEDVVELLAVVEVEGDEVAWELLLVVLAANEEVGELDGATEVVVVGTDVTDGRAARQVQTAWADEDAGIAPPIPQELITHPIAKPAML
jgi:hypothetical protein